MKNKRFSIFIPTKFVAYKRIEYRCIHETETLYQANECVNMYCEVQGLSEKAVWIKDNYDTKDNVGDE